MTTDSAFIDLLISATEQLQAAETVAPDDVLRLHIHRALLELTSAVAEAAPRTVVNNNEVH